MVLEMFSRKVKSDFESVFYGAELGGARDETTLIYVGFGSVIWISAYQSVN